ncbi:hypothetical protein PY254_03885 [Rhodanobacter sp. AS-Z3]|uniref:hypothetical protein n=1 Tax=Rhodanobacter sp. AS-Z3 TaxID=3031330 RepID=UPI0024788B30|nr:hypothetical protein [Rhodanobacter sp. AS-Z3]WEN15821.1 hypothetical protein PY254_03885 [Rhodanobacter sp. AS-Z3]
MKHISALFRLAPPVIVSLLLSLLTACAGASFHAGPAPTIERSANWVVAPLLNNTATPYAGQRAAQLVSALLAQRGVGAVQVATAPADAGGLPIDNGAGAEEAAKAFALQQHARYLVRGSVDEWTYKIGLDGQPAVSFTVSVVDLESDKVIWTGAASASGGSRQGVAVLAQETLDRLTARLMGK